MKLKIAAISLIVKGHLVGCLITHYRERIHTIYLTIYSHVVSQSRGNACDCVHVTLIGSRDCHMRGYRENLNFVNNYIPVGI